MTKPDLTMSSDFIKQSNWYKVREAYAAKLEEAGQSALADQVRKRFRQNRSGGQVKKSDSNEASFCIPAVSTAPIQPTETR